MTYEQLTLPICPNANVTASDFRARLSVLLETDEASRIHEELYFLKSCGWLKSDTLKYFSQKMLLDFLTMRGGVTFGVIISTMAELGYSVEWQVLDSQNYGVPQHRERTFIIGHLGNGSGRKVFPIGTDDCEADELQRQPDRNRVINNTLAAGDRNSAGTYIATDRQTDRQTDIPQGKWIPQEGHAMKGILRPIDVAHTLDTKCGSIPGFWANYVMEK